MIKLEVDASGFESWMSNAIRGVEAMVETLMEISAIIEVYTRPLVPLDIGYLENSYTESVYSEFPLFEMEVKYTGKDNPNARGYDYAYIQHEVDFNHPKRGEMLYLERGVANARGEIFTTIEKDYLTALGL